MSGRLRGEDQYSSYSRSSLCIDGLQLPNDSSVAGDHLVPCQAELSAGSGKRSQIHHEQCEVGIVAESSANLAADESIHEAVNYFASAFRALSVASLLVYRSRRRRRRRNQR